MGGGKELPNSLADHTKTPESVIDHTITTEYLTLVSKGNQTSAKCADVIKAKYNISQDQLRTMLANMMTTDIVKAETDSMGKLAFFEKHCARYQLAKMAGDTELARQLAKEMGKYFAGEDEDDEGDEDDEEEDADSNEIAPDKVEAPKSETAALEHEGWVILDQK